MSTEEVQYITQLFEQKIASVERLLTLRLDAQEKALMLQAAEYERRLKYLNGEAERLRQMQATYVPREVYDRVDEQRCEDIKALESYRDTQLGKQAALSAVVAAVVSIATVLIVRLAL